MYYKPLLTFHKDIRTTTMPFVSVNLPSGIHILTLKKIRQPQEDGEFLLLRLEHIYSKGTPSSHEQLSNFITASDEEQGIPVTVNINNIFTGAFSLSQARETLLGGNVFVGDTFVEEVTLQPLDIKTFITRLSYSNF